MLPYLEEKTPSEVEEIRKTIQDLFRQTCILHVKYDPESLLQRNNPKYQVCNKHREFIAEYVEVLGCELVHDPEEQIFYLRGQSMPVEHLSLSATKILLLVRLLYHEKMMGSSLDTTITNLQEIRERGRDTNLLNMRLTAAEWYDALNVMKIHQMIELPCAVRNVEDSTPIYIYPTINMFLKSMDMEAMLADFANGQEEQADAGQQIMTVEENNMSQDTNDMSHGMNDIDKEMKRTDGKGKVE